MAQEPPSQDIGPEKDLPPPQVSVCGWCWFEVDEQNNPIGDRPHPHTTSTSDGICNACLRKYYPRFAEVVIEENKEPDKNKKASTGQ